MKNARLFLSVKIIFLTMFLLAVGGFIVDAKTAPSSANVRDGGTIETQVLSAAPNVPNFMLANGNPINPKAGVRSAVNLGKWLPSFDAPDFMPFVLNSSGAGGNFIFGESFTTSAADNFTAFVVNSTADTNDGACNALGTGTGNQNCTLREAINLANADAGTETITFDLPGEGPHMIQLTAALPALSESANILNTSGESITVRGEGAADRYRIFTINAGVTATISGLTITNGNINGGGISKLGG
jgi:CSLREA domain-containing protein